MSSRELEAQKLQKEWSESPRWRGIKRGYTADDVVRLRGSVAVEHTLAKRGAEKLWRAINDEPFVNSGQGRPEGHLPVGLASCR